MISSDVFLSNFHLLQSYSEMSILTVLLLFLLQCLYDQAVHCGNVLKEINFANDYNEYKCKYLNTNQKFTKKWLVIWISNKLKSDSFTTKKRLIYTVKMFNIMQHVVMNINHIKLHRNSKLINASLITGAKPHHTSTVNLYNISAPTAVNSELNYVLFINDHQLWY